jgi:hypothetical protein
MSLRFHLWLWQWLLAVDQLLGVAVSLFTYVIMGRGHVWDADETISSRVGRGAIKGKRWALILERVIDSCAHAISGEVNHCRCSIGS